MFIEPTITWVPSGSLNTYGLTQKLCLKNKIDPINEDVKYLILKRFHKIFLKKIIIGTSVISDNHFRIEVLV